jgi:hypothetical protein
MAWEVLVDGGVWVSYDTYDAAILDVACAKHQPIVSGIRGRGHVYTIDLQVPCAVDRLNFMELNQFVL